MKKIEIKVAPHSSNMSHYALYYRNKTNFSLLNIFIPWIRLNVAHNICVLFDNFESAVEYAKTLKMNPKLIEEHNKREDEKYKKYLKERNDYYNSRNKTIKL